MSESEHSLYADSQPGIPVNEQASQRLQQWRDFRHADAAGKLTQNIPPIDAQQEVQRLSQAEAISPQDKLKTSSLGTRGLIEPMPSILSSIRVLIFWA